ncbi:unnamed protein product [Parajaminaea phylloscopi]
MSASQASSSSSADAGSQASSSSPASSSHPTSPSATAADLPPSPTNETLTLSPSQREAEAAKLKDEGNKAFLAARYEDAKTKYGESLVMNPNDAKVWSNRAACELKLEQHGLAIEDATKAIALDATFTKAYFRRASAYLSIVQPKKALPDLQYILKLEPGNRQVQQQAQDVQKLIRRLAFAAAIRTEDGPSTSQLTVEHLKQGSGGSTVPEKYAGPRLSEGPEGEEHLGQITAEFVDEMIEFFKKDGQLPLRYVWQIILGAHRQLEKEGSLVDHNITEGSTIKVIGDTHGQYFDFLHLLSLTGKPSPDNVLLFNGDWSDRGSKSMEIALTLFAWKWLSPKSILLTRGNHETDSMNQVYGFKDEVLAKCGGPATYDLFKEVYLSLPLAFLLSSAHPPAPVEDLPWDTPTRLGQQAILSSDGRKRYFVTHGGLFAKDGVTLDDIRKVERRRQPGTEGIMVDLLWADPQAAPGRAPSKRGVGSGFGPDVTRAWCELNKVTGVIRSHEVRMDGWEYEHEGLCMTVFSAPRYCGSMENKGAFATIDARGTLRVTRFEAVPESKNLPPMAYSNRGLGGMLR